MNLITVTQDFLKANPDTAERLLRAYIEGVGSMIRDKTLASKIFSKYFKRSDPGFLDESYSIVTKFLERISPSRSAHDLDRRRDQVDQRGDRRRAINGQARRQQHR